MKNNSVNKTKILTVLTVLTIAITLSLGIYLYQGKEVSLYIDDEVTVITSHSKTVGDLLKSEEIQIEEGAYISTDLDMKIEDKMNIFIKSPKTYTLNLGGAIEEFTSTKETVGEILKDLDIKLGDKDYTNPKLDVKISPNSTIEVFKVEEVVEKVEKPIPFEKIVNNNKNLEKGVTNVVQKGSDGLKEDHILKRYVNGKLVKTETIKEEVVKKPISNIVERGTKAKEIQIASRGKTPYTKSLTMTATAYDLSYKSTGKRPGDKYYGITASGTKARPGVVAVDPKVIPLGTRLYIQSLDGSKDYGYAIAEDTGGAIKNNKIDLFFSTSKEVRNFGRRKVKVFILK